jgi:hypothetical protein
MEVTYSFETLDDFYRTTRRYSSRDIAVGIATGYGLDDRGVGIRVPVESRIFSSPRRPDRFWGPHSRGVKLTTHLQLVPRSKKYGSIHPFPPTPSWGTA